MPSHALETMTVLVSAVTPDSIGKVYEPKRKVLNIKH